MYQKLLVMIIIRGRFQIVWPTHCVSFTAHKHAALLAFRGTCVRTLFTVGWRAIFRQFPEGVGWKRLDPGSSFSTDRNVDKR